MTICLLVRGDTSTAEGLHPLQGVHPGGGHATRGCIQEAHPLEGRGDASTGRVHPLVRDASMGCIQGCIQKWMHLPPPVNRMTDAC